MRSLLTLLGAFVLAPLARATDPPAQAWEKAVADAAARKPMTVADAEAFIRKLHDYVRDNHLKADANSPQKGMLYEYFDTTRKGKFDQWVQGEALDTMHDGAWYAMGMVHAYRATGDRRYREFLRDYQLPFYTKVLNHSDTLFNTKQVDVAEKGVKFNKEHALQPGEKGFCPYWWDDGASVSLERRRLKDPLVKPPFACTDLLAGKPNPEAKLAGYSHGSSNHLAQDLGPMLMLGWLTFRDSSDPAEKKLAADCAEAAKNLQECRTRHGFNGIPAVVSAAGITHADKDLLKRIGEPKLTLPSNHYTRFLLGTAKPDDRQSTPGFMDDAAYTYYTHLADGKIPPAVCFKLIYDTYTEPMLFRFWSAGSAKAAGAKFWPDGAHVPPGLNRFDLIGQYGKGGKFESYRADKTVPVGSRFGPQNMVVSAWALQLLDESPGLWDKSVDQLCGKELRAGMMDSGVGLVLDGKAEAGSSEAFGLGSSELRVVGQDTSLVIWGKFAGGGLEFVVAGAGGKAVVTLKVADGKVTSQAVESGDGTPLRFSASTFPEKGGPTTFEVQIPYTIVRSQKPWLNGVELGRYTISVGKESKTFVLASSEKQVKAELEKELSAGLRTWEAIFAAKGYIPTSLNAGGDWDKFSDTGGYAHLISAASQYILWKQKKHDWESHGQK